jgi:hypothetical protein
MRRIIQQSAFPVLLGMAAAYALTAAGASLLAADVLARTSWPCSLIDQRQICSL